MTDAHQTLIDLLTLERLEVDLFRGTGEGGETPTRIFGGQVIGQALAAAYRTVEDRLCHSLHAYFIRPGDPAAPVIYQVDRARDGGSFTTRRVVAVQHGRQILNMSASFHAGENGWSHQHPAPEVPAPEGLKDRIEIYRARLNDFPAPLRDEVLRDRPIDIREVRPRDIFAPEPAEDVAHLWFRMSAAAGLAPDMQHCLLAYASDLNLLGTALRPHGQSWHSGAVMGASLDHAMWFHAQAEFDDWHLYTMDSPWAGDGRGFNRGKIYDRAGTLIASVAQEGLMRPRNPGKG